MLVCFAMKEEAAAFRSISAGESGATILVTGIGRINAEKSVRGFLATNPVDLVLTCGFAGGLSPELEVGDVLYESASDGARSQPARQMIGAGPDRSHDACFKKLVTSGAKPAKFFCADRIATTAIEKATLRAETGADAVEMESGAIHAVCIERGIDCATLRSISDTADQDLPLDFNLLARSDLSLDYGKLMLAIAKSPAKIPALMRLQKNSKLAAQRLAEVLTKFILPQ